MKKLLTLLVALVLVCSCFAGMSFAEENYDPDAIIYLTNTNDPTHLDPAYAEDDQSTIVTGSLYSALVGYNRDGSLFGDVAESWDVSEDGTVYTFHIRQGIKFHDGTVCDANAVAWNWNRVMPENATADMTYSSVLYGNVDHFEVADDYTFVVYLKSSDSTFLTLAGSNSLAAGLVSPTAYEADPEGFDRNPVGCGPYKFVEWVSGQYVRLERYDDYHGGKVANGGIVIKIIPESSTAVSELMAGGIDVLNTVSNDQTAMLDADPNCQLFSVPGKNLSIFSFADYAQNSLFSDIRLRQAVCYALDMESINAALFGDAMENATSPIPTCMQAGDVEYDCIGYDPEKAKELMTEAGYPDGFEFTLLCYNIVKSYNTAGEQLAVTMQAELAKVGITMNIETLPWAEFLEKTHEDPVEGYDAVMHGWGADYNDTSNILFLFTEAEAGGGNNNSGYVSEEYEAYYKAALTATSYEEAGENYAKAAQVLLNDTPVYILGHAKEYLAASAAIINPEEGIGGWGNHAHYWMLKKAA